MKSMSEVYVVSMIVDMMKDGHVNLDHFCSANRSSGRPSSACA